jgi:hypothetical protein
MNGCNRLYPARNIRAYTLPGGPRALDALVISAEVEVNPFEDLVEICPNLLGPGYVVVARAKQSGIHPPLVMSIMISASFPIEVLPATVVVYAPQPTEVPVAAGPPPPIAPAVTAPHEATGWSKDFVLQEALFNAITELRAAAGLPNPDVGLPFEIIAAGGQVGGFTLRTGVFVKVKTA